MPTRRIEITVSRVACYLVGAASLFFTLGFTSCNQQTTTAGGGLRIQTLYNGVAVNGANFLCQYWGPATFKQYYTAGSDEGSINTTSSYNSYYGQNGYYYNSQKKSPATWSFTWLNSGLYAQCSVNVGNDARATFVPAAYGVNTASCVNLGEEAEIDPSDPITAVTFSPVALNENDLPGTVSASGPGTFSSTYGEPVIQFYDDTGDFVVQEMATSTTSTEVTFPTPSLSYGPGAGIPYFVLILNEDVNGDYYLSGNGVIHVFQPGGCKAPPCTQSTHQ